MQSSIQYRSQSSPRLPLWQEPVILSQMTWTVVLMGGICSHWEMIMKMSYCHNDHHNWQLESRAHTESWEPWAANRERRGHLHSALEHSTRVPGPGTLAAGIHQHEDMGGISWCRVLLIIQVKEAKSNLKILNSRVAFPKEEEWETKQKPLQLSIDWRWMEMLTWKIIYRIIFNDVE